MAEIFITVEKQVLTVTNKDVISSGDVNYDTCAFTFDSTWDGYIKTAVFYQDKEHVHYTTLDENDSCVVPAAAMVYAGAMYIGVFGINSPKILTSTVDRIDLLEGAVTGSDINLEPTDDIYIAILANYQEIRNQMAVHVELSNNLQYSYETFQKEVEEDIVNQNAYLEKLGSFNAETVLDRLDEVQSTVNGFDAKLDENLKKFTVLRGVTIQFVEGQCIIENESISKDDLCDVYFDEYSYEFACHASIFVSSYDGYLLLLSSVNIDEPLTADITIRRFD